MKQYYFTSNQARAFITECQLLSQRFPAKEKGTLSVIEHLGYVQIDTISVVARAHHHILWSRVHKYDRGYLTKLEAQREIFEYWAHAASYLPMRDFRYSLVPKKDIINGPGHWRPRNKKWTGFVLDRITAEGALMAKDFNKDPTLNEDHAWGGHPVTQALRQLFMEGRIMIAGRKGFQKIYDLTEHVLPEWVDTSMPKRDDYYRYLILRDLRANGIMTESEIGHLITIPKKERTRLLAQLIDDGTLVEVIIGRKNQQVLYGLRENIESWTYRTKSKKIHLLSPFDNLLIQRKRMLELFQFDYTLECYVPPKKRKVGYYSLPILYGHQFVGQIDLKADRKKGLLIVKNLVWEPGVRKLYRIKDLLHAKLLEYMKFNECEKIDPKFLSA